MQHYLHNQLNAEVVFLQQLTKQNISVIFTFKQIDYKIPCSTKLQIVYPSAFNIQNSINLQICIKCIQIKNSTILTIQIIKY